MSVARLAMGVGLLFVCLSFFWEGGDGVSPRVFTGVWFLALGVFIAAAQRQRARPSPVRLVFIRWIRWFLFAFVFALVSVSASRVLEFGAPLSFWRMFAAGALLWLLYETELLWLGVRAASFSEYPLLPRFENWNDFAWPNRADAVALRSALRDGGWTAQSAFRARVGDEVALGVRAFLSADRRMRASVYFIPQMGGGTACAVALESRTRSGERLITDNLFLPYGGFYPEHWYVERRPWTRAFARLLRRHETRVDAVGADIAALEAETAADMDADRRELERVNLEMGFFTPPEARDAEGRITPAGRTRLWSEILTLNYFNRARFL